MAATEVLAVSQQFGDEHHVAIPGRGRVVLDSAHKSITAYSVGPQHSHDVLVLTYRLAVPLFLHATGAEVLHASASAVAGRVYGFCADSSVRASGWW